LDLFINDNATKVTHMINVTWTLVDII